MVAPNDYLLTSNATSSYRRMTREWNDVKFFSTRCSMIEVSTFQIFSPPVIRNVRVSQISIIPLCMVGMMLHTTVMLRLCWAFFLGFSESLPCLPQDSDQGVGWDAAFPSKSSE